MKIRFLVPFAIFFTLFVISSATCYVVYSESERLKEATEVATYDRNNDVFENARHLHSEIAKLDENVTGYGHGAGSAFPHTALTQGSFIGPMQKTTVWLRNRKRELTRVTNIKSQQATDFYSMGSIRTSDQVARINTTLAALQPMPAASGIDTQLRQIDENVGEYGRLMNKEFVPVRDQMEAAEKMREAQLAVREAIDALAPAGSILDENDVPALQKLVVLALLLFHNDSQFVTRSFRQAQGAAALTVSGQIGEWYPHYNGPMPPADVMYSYLVSDYYRDPRFRQFNTNPYYLTGATLEEIINTQDLLIDSLLKVNRHLFERYVAWYGKTPDPNDANETWVARITDRARGTTLRVRAHTDEIERDADARRAEQERMEEDEGDIEEELETKFPDMEERLGQFGIRPLRSQHGRFETLIQAHEDDQAALEESFMEIRKDAARTNYPIYHGGGDGEVIYADNDNQIYHINLGRADGIHLGMRFLVFDDTRGRSDIKGLIEVVRMSGSHFSICSLVTGATGVSGGEIVEGNKLENRLYHEGRFLRVALIGRFFPPNTRYYEAELVQYLLELGVPILGFHAPQDPDDAARIDGEEVGPEVELFILASSADKMIARRAVDMRLFLELRRRTHVDEVMGEDLWIYFQNQ